MANEIASAYIEHALRVGQYVRLQLFRLWTKVRSFSSPNVGWVVVDQTLFPFSTCLSVPAIFTLKVESCVKSRRILHIFGPPIFGAS